MPDDATSADAPEVTFLPAPPEVTVIVVRGGRLYVGLGAPPAPIGATYEEALASLPAWRRAMPEGTELRPLAREGGAVEMVFAGPDGRVHTVPPNAGILAGFRYARSRRGFRLRAGLTCEHMARALGLLIHSREGAFAVGEPL